MAEGNDHGRAGARERLLEATSVLLSQKDTLDISLNDISAQANLNHGLVSYYFGGKEKLLLALLERDAARALQQLDQLVSSDLPPLRKLELHIRGVINVYHRYPYINRLINALQSGSAEMAQALARIFIAPLQAFQAHILAECRADGSIRPVEPGLFYYTVIGACEFLFHSRNTLPFLPRASAITAAFKDEYADHLVTLLINGLRAKPAQ